MFQILESFLFSKTQLIKLENKSMKLNAYKGYLVPVKAYASQAWSTNKGEMSDIQKRATSWIFGIWENYNNRLKRLELLPLMSSEKSR